MPIEYPEDEMVSPAKSSTPSTASYEFSGAAVAVKYANELENILEESFGATGKTMHEKISSVEHVLPQGVKTKLRAIATIRGKMMQEIFFEVPDALAYEAQCRECLTELRALSGEGKHWKLVGFISLGISGFAGFSIGVRNFGIGAGIAFAVVFMLFCAWILWPRTLCKTFINQQKKHAD